MMAPVVYDRLADSYDAHFTRPVDQWEDARLARLLAPLVNGRAVLDLGCGTGWVLDHLRPASYTGVDSSPAMLAELLRKHRQALTVKASIGEPGWQLAVPGWGYQVITATWSLQYLGDLAELLAACAGLAPAGVLALHGYLPRYQRRSHAISRPPSRLPGPAAVRAATASSGLLMPRVAGTGALPDALAHWKPLWQLALAVPARYHYAALWTWQVPP
jgi:predicted TPR repeat methyltransferase